MVFTKWLPLIIFRKKKVPSFKRSRKSPESSKCKTFGSLQIYIIWALCLKQEPIKKKGIGVMVSTKWVSYKWTDGRTDRQTDVPTDGQTPSIANSMVGLVPRNPPNKTLHIYFV